MPWVIHVGNYGHDGAKKNALKSAQQYELATANSYLACEKHSGRCPGCKKVFLEMA